MVSPNIISVDESNIDSEDICCALADPKHKDGVGCKKDWLKMRMKEGLQFRKLNIRGKVFIEYLPAEHAWKPVEAPGYMLIDCLWVSGQYKGHGYAVQLLEACERDAAGMNGVVVVTSDKIKPFLTDPKFYAKHGYEPCDSAPPYFRLFVKKFNDDAPFPYFRESAKKLQVADKDGLYIYYTDQCPFTTYYTGIMKDAAEARGIKTKLVHLIKHEDAREAPCAFGTFCVFYNGEFLTHEILSQKKLDKILDGLC